MLGIFSSSPSFSFSLVPFSYLDSFPLSLFPSCSLNVRPSICDTSLLSCSLLSCVLFWCVYFYLSFFFHSFRADIPFVPSPHTRLSLKLSLYHRRTTGSFSWLVLFRCFILTPFTKFLYLLCFVQLIIFSQTSKTSPRYYFNLIPIHSFHTQYPALIASLSSVLIKSFSSKVSTPPTIDIRPC